jgi:SulP family sulfate permease
VARTFPVSTSLPGYPKRNGRHDLIAGVTVAALAIPSAMAYAELAGLSPVAGLYALLLPAVAYAVFGSSRQLVVGPEGALALLVVAAVAPLAAGSATTYALLAAMLAILVGAIAVVGRVIRLGWIADYFSRCRAGRLPARHRHRPGLRATGQDVRDPDRGRRPDPPAPRVLP